jgi:lysozyme
MYMADGVDVSAHQGNIDWTEARVGRISFAYVKLTEGVGYVDRMADEHQVGARAAGIVTGVYHLARPDTNTGVEDARHFAAECNLRYAAGPGNLPPCLDIEQSYAGGIARTTLIRWISAFLATARRQTGRRQFMLYSSAAFLSGRLGGLGWLDHDCLVWVAHYGREPGRPGFRDSRTVMHQYTERGRIPGYTKDIDLDTCWVDLNTLTLGPRPPHLGGEFLVHVVEEGENLTTIARRYNVHGGWQVIWNLNRDTVGDPDVIFAGQSLRIPK